MSDTQTAILLVCVAALVWGFVDVYRSTRDQRQRLALLRWRSKLSQLHEDHMTARDAWTRQGNAKHTHLHARVVAAAKALMAHLEAMPLPAGESK